MKKYVLSIDQGTTSCRAIVFNEYGGIEGVAQKEISQIFPNPGWVEHDPEEIFLTQMEVIENVLIKNNILPQQIETIGITNQRETTVLWDKNTGKPVYNAIVWQSRQTEKICQELREKNLDEYIKENTGLIIDPYFSATKIKWIFDNVSGVKQKAEQGDILFGTIDTWLIWKMTEGKLHITDYSNASRTMIFNIKDLKWDEYLLENLDIPKSILPEVKMSSDLYGYTSERIFGSEIKISGIAGDQQSALFGECCFEKGAVKNTYGTGCFILMNTGKERIQSQNGLVTTIAWGIDGQIEYALEGSVFMGGATIQWLRDGLGILESSKESEFCALQVNDTNGVYFVPSFTGLGTPYWDTDARGIITGLTRGVNRNHIVRAGLEAIAFQTSDVINAMEKDAKTKISTLRVDGGASANNFLMQFQSDILDCDIIRLKVIETTAMGAAFLAGLAVGFWKDKDELKGLLKMENLFQPQISYDKRIKLISGWNKAIEKAMSTKI